MNMMSLQVIENPVRPDLDPTSTTFINATHARINHGGNRAYYMPAMDLVWLPPPNDFESYQHYLATALHELAHWSGAKHRLDRQLNNRSSTRAYAAEELVAELSAAFLCAHLNIEGKLRHAEYIANWLELLREDPRAIFTAASKASQAADFLRSFSEVAEEAAWRPRTDTRKVRLMKNRIYKVLELVGSSETSIEDTTAWRINASRS